MICRTPLLLASFVALLANSPIVRADDAAYVQTKNIVFAEVDGVGLLMDVFTPTGKPNGLGIVDVASGAFFSDRGKIEDHKRAQMFDIFCGKGYTVFAVRPGSINKFTLAEMSKNLKQGVAWVKEHAEDYKIDPARLGLTGASAGGHLASLVALTCDEKSSVKAAGVFFPPTDFLEYRGNKIDDKSTPAQLASVKRFVILGGGDAEASEIIAKLKAVSPALCVTSKAPPFLIIHGDADPLVPLAQSEKLLAALKAPTCPAN